MGIKLQITNTNNEIIGEDNVEISDGDILLVELLDNNIPPEKAHKILKNISEVLRNYKKDPNNIHTIGYFKENMNFKVLKVTKE